MTPKRRPEYRPGFGGDYLPADDEQGRLTALRRFLEAVDRLVPACRSELVAIAADVPDRVPSQLIRGQHPDQPLRTWAAKWGFTSVQLIRIARSTAARIRRRPTLAGWALTGGYWCPDFEPFDNPQWNPIEETEASFRARVETYIKATAATPGLKKIPVVRSGQRAFDWLVLHHVAGRKYPRIAGSRGDIGTISRSVNQAAALVGLTLRHPT